MKLPDLMYTEKAKKTEKGFGVICVLFIITVLVLAEIASVRVAKIFNREMEKQDMLRGKITVEAISANIKGDVVFENLLWTKPDGTVILKVPEGSFHARPWDVITGHFKSTTIQKLELHDALISVGFDEDMQVDFLARKKRGRIGRPHSRSPVSEWIANSPEHEEANFNRDGRKLKAEIILHNCKLGAHYRNRHYLMNNVNMTMKLDTSDTSYIDLSTGKFGGTMVGGGVSVEGTVNFKPKNPELDIDLSIREVDPASLGFGMKIHDLMTVVTKLTGPVTSPTGRGTVRMKELTIPALQFKDVIGDVNYSDSVFRFTDVNAKVFGGHLKAIGDYHLDSRKYSIYGKGTGLDSKLALKDLNFSCLINMNLSLHCDGNPRNILAYGNFESGKGHYSILPFERLEGRFSNRFKELHIYDAKIETAFGTVSTDAFSVINGKLTLEPIVFTDPETGKVITIKKLLKH